MPEIRAARLNGNLQDIIKRDLLIAKLRKITIERGATPAEASTAAAKIASLETRAVKAPLALTTGPLPDTRGQYRFFRDIFREALFGD